MSLGVLLIWQYLIIELGNWLTGYADVNVGTNQPSMIVFLVSAIALLVAAIAQNAFQRFSEMHAAPLVAAVIAVLGSLLLAASGSTYAVFPVLSRATFLIGCFLCGVGCAMMTLRIGQLYCDLEPDKVLLYSLLSEIIFAVLFFIIIGNTWFASSWSESSLGSYVAMVVAPAVAMLLASLPKSAKTTSEEREQEEIVSGISIRSFLSTFPAMRKLLISILVFSFASSCVCNCFMAYLGTDSYQLIAIRTMSFCLLLTICLLLFAVFHAQSISLSRFYHRTMLILMIIIAVTPLVGLKYSVLFSFTNALAYLFTLVVWCLLAFVAKSVKVRPHLVFGLGVGCLHLGRALVDVLNYVGMFDSVRDSGTMGLQMMTILILLVIACIGIISTEKDVDAILEASGATNINLLAAMTSTETDSKRDKSDRPWQKACQIVGGRAMLSEREQSILEELSRNRSPQEIAAHLNITVSTVRTHTHRIYTKLNVHSRDELIELVRHEYESLEQ